MIDKRLVRAAVVLLSLIPLCFTGCKDKGAGGGNVPSVTYVSIFPEAPGSGDVLKAEVTYTTLETDPNQVVVEYKWHVNGKEVEFGSSNEYSLGFVEEGTEVYVKARARDKFGIGEWVSSRPVKIVLKDSAVAGVEVVPKEAYPNTPLSAVVDFGKSDPENTEIFYQWYVNDQVVDGADEEVLEPGPYHQGDRVKVRVCTDGDFEGPTFKASFYVQIRNRNPNIISGPHMEAGEDEIVFWVEAEDPDDDTLSFRLLAGPPGSRLDPYTGEGTCPVSNDIPEVFRVSIQAMDNYGGWAAREAQFRFNYKEGEPPVEQEVPIEEGATAGEEIEEEEFPEEQME